MLDLENIFSDSAKAMKASVIRELLKLIREPGIISFAGGLPAPETFPTEKIKEITSSIIEREGAFMMQYGPTEGDPNLKAQILKLMKNEDDYPFDNENVLVTTASQQGLDMTGKLFVNSGDTIVVGVPTYLGALQSFSAYKANYMGIDLDEEGLITSDLEEKLEAIKKRNEKMPKFIYVIPDFQNPTGITMSLNRRNELLRIAYKFGIPILEDSPYRALRYSGESIPTILSLDKKGYVISMYTFSKTMLPGLRLGWLVSQNKEIIQKLTIIKQGTDLCTPPFTQAIAAEFVKLGHLETQITNNVAYYKQKLKFMLNALEKEMPKIDGLSWTKPEGGMFLWVKLPDHMSADDLFPKAVKEKVAYVIGSAFHCNGKGQNTLRVNFSYSTIEDIDLGIKRLAKVIKDNA
ncbi:MAG: PLP-dependent aminotransferase family protein [Candidatus Muirbacterium halophilum]|nr:PLP-dependent aminotransferase family protein [Candidatus Muirbacterium halophilum]MCK9475762.1 PLP-dependent aminotransferase family protein [Candidatus Muirbacterium halophilum]